MKNKIIIFDIDDTIYKEIDFLKSGYKALINRIKTDYKIELSYDLLIKEYFEGKNVFQNIIYRYPYIKLDYLLNIYRYHNPDINLPKKELNCLKKLKEIVFSLGIITDGRSVTQRNKLKSLGILNIFNDIIISEEFGSCKPALENYIFFEKKYPNKTFYYVGDNILKDFVTPNKLKWITVGVNDINNYNIHKQSFNISNEYLPKYWIDDICELLNLIIIT